MHKNDQEFLVQKIRTQYTEKEHSRLDALKEMDRKVKRPANVFAYVFGSLGAIIMGCGMSLVMTDLGAVFGLENPVIPGVVIGIMGMILAAMAYPTYRRILRSERQRIAPEILQLSEELMK